MLSRRAIYFVGDKLFYRCRAAEYSEHYTDIPSQHLGIDSTLGSVLSAAVLMERPIADYGTMLSYYTQRALTDQKDTHRAMAGIIRRSMGVMRCQPTAVLTGLSSFMRTTAFYSAALPFQVIHGQAAEEVSGKNRLRVGEVTTKMLMNGSEAEPGSFGTREVVLATPVSSGTPVPITISAPEM